MLRTRRVVLPALVVAIVAGSTLVTRAQAPSLRRPCDQTDQALCLLPFPNDYFTRPDPTTATGKRIDFELPEMPRSIVGKPIDPTEWNRNDGFSPGSEILTFVPGLDLHRTWGTQSMTGSRVGGPNDPRDQIADIGRYLEPDAPILVIDATTGQRWPFWSELDMNAGTAANQRILLLRPAINFTEGHRYLVALRNMKNTGGVTIPAGAQFAAYRDNSAGPASDLTFDESRRAHINSVIAQIQNDEQARGMSFDRSKLFLAWDFTVASERNLTERMLHIRNDAFAQLGDTNLADRVIQGVSPRFSITKVTQISNDPRKQRQVEGTITVPNYLDGPPQPLGFEEDPVEGLPNQALLGTRFFYGPDGLPAQNPLIPTIDVPFVCTIPKVASAADPAHPTLYGHGLLGSRSESTGGSTDRDRERNFMPCAVNWMGFAEYDVANAVHTLLDPSYMPVMADRAQQGFLNFLYLGRALAHPNGLVTNAAFKDAAGHPLFKSNELFYDGNSQGGIMGGALCALSVDLTRCVLGVTGMNYSTLLNRSSDWEGPVIDPTNPGIPSYSSLLYTAFPNKMEQQLVMTLLQMLWDRAEADGYVAHMTTDPLPDTPAHQVLMQVALGDFQVTNFSAMVEARTIGARILQTALMPGRAWTVAPTLGTEPFPGGLQALPTDAQGNVLPWNGSALVFWDAGNLPPPNANIPPADVGNDPHEIPRRDPNAANQKELFYMNGLVEDVMNGQPDLACPPGYAGEIPEAPAQFSGFDWCK